MTQLPFEPGSLNDPVALATAWTPCRKGGANFGTRKLVTEAADRVAFRPTLRAILFGLAFLACVTPFVFGPLFAVKENLGTFGFSLGVLAAFALFGGAGILILRLSMPPIVFDRTRGLFWAGSRDPEKARARGMLVELRRVRALQLISQLVTSASSASYTSYELNLVLDDGSRVNVVEHGSLTRMQRDSAALAAFLGLPCWNAT